MKTQSVRRRSPHRGNRRSPARKYPPKQRRNRSPLPRGRKESGSFGRLSESGKSKDRRDFTRSPPRRRSSRSPLRRSHSPIGRVHSPLWRNLTPQRSETAQRRSQTTCERSPPPRQGLYLPKRKSPGRDRRSPATRKKSRSRSPNRTSRSNTAKRSYSGTPHSGAEALNQTFPVQQGQSYTLSPSGDIDERQTGLSAFSDRFNVGENDPDYDEKPVFHGPEGGLFDRSELKKITVDIRRNIPWNSSTVLRKIQNPEDVVVVRRQGARYEASPPRYKDYKEPTRGTADKYYPPTDPMYPPPRDQGGSHPQEFGSQSQHSWSRSRECLRDRDRGYIDTERPAYYDRNKDRFREDREEERRKDDFHRDLNWRKPEDEHRPEPDLRHELAWRKGDDAQYPENYLGNQTESVRDFRRSPVDERRRERRRSDNRNYESRSEDLRRELDWRKNDDNRFQSGQKNEERSSDLRHRINEKRTDRIDERRVREQPPSDRREEVDMRERLNERRGLRLTGSGSSERKRDADREKRRGSPLDNKPRFKSPREPERGKGAFKGDDCLPEKAELPNFSQRADKYQYKPWEDPEFVPRGGDYFEHDNRDVRGSFIRPVTGRGRGFSRGWGSGFGGRGFSRGFRGARFSNTFRGRGRGVLPRMKSTSPHQWKHDMFDKMTTDDFKPSNTASDLK